MVRKSQAHSSQRLQQGNKSRQNRASSSTSKSATAASAITQNALVPAPSVPLKTQQLVLDIFQRSFAHLFEPADAAAVKAAATASPGDGDEDGDEESEPPGLTLTPLLKEMKAALFARDFAAAFENARPALLEAYAARWSPTRALGYAGILAGMEGHLESIATSVEGEGHGGRTEANDAGGTMDEKKEEGEAESGDNSGASPSKRHVRVLAIGGGTAEVAALAAFLSFRNDVATGNSTPNSPPSPPPPSPLTASMTLLDSAPWDPVITQLQSNLTSPPPLSKYASAAAKAANRPFLDASSLDTSFVKADVLSATKEQLRRHLASDRDLASGPSPQPQPLLITLLFTLNELYTTAGIGKTTAFLLNLTAVVPPGSLLLVVDSPGSYSEAAVGKESKKYPMHWLLDHCLLNKARSKNGDKDADAGKNAVESGTAAGDNVCVWEKLEERDSVWFRLSDSLRYPIQLENMRYQMHLYRATTPASKTDTGSPA